MYILKKSDIGKLVNLLKESYKVYGPVYNKESDSTIFDVVEDFDSFDVNLPIPYNSPKEVVFPQLEKILSFSYDEESKQASVKREDTVVPKALLGVRPCDLVGILSMDRFFMGQEFVDEVYLSHRKEMFIVTNTCVLPFEQCFCVCTDSGPYAKEGYDINLTLVDDNYIVETGSEKGEEVVQKLSLEKTGDDKKSVIHDIVDNSVAQFEPIAKENKAWVSRVMNRITTGFIDNEVWEYIGNQCFECGACSFVCPTCSCFNVEDVVLGKTSHERLRTWDSCSFEGYTRMAGDHNPRKPIEDRRNKRFFCKLSYSQSKKYLRPGCVGCGRCARVCPGDIGLPNVVTYIRKEITRQV